MFLIPIPRFGRRRQSGPGTRLVFGVVFLAIAAYTASQMNAEPQCDGKTQHSYQVCRSSNGKTWTYEEKKAEDQRDNRIAAPIFGVLGTVFLIWGFVGLGQVNDRPVKGAPRANRPPPVPIGASPYGQQVAAIAHGGYRPGGTPPPAPYPGQHAGPAVPTYRPFGQTAAPLAPPAPPAQAWAPPEPSSPPTIASLRPPVERREDGRAASELNHDLGS